MQFPEGLEDSPFKLNVLKNPGNCRIHATLISKVFSHLVPVQLLRNLVVMELSGSFQTLVRRFSGGKQLSGSRYAGF